MKRTKIAVYSDYPAESGVIRYSLAESFNTRSMDTRYIGQKDILDRSACKPDTVIVLPGAPHGDGYRSQLRGDGYKNLRRHLYDGGGLLTICAATYTSCPSYTFEKDDGTIVTHTSDFAILNAHSHGPIKELSDPDKRWGGAWARHDVAILNFKDEYGDEHETGVCYSKGGLINLDPAEQCDIIARFKKLAGRPPAIVGKSFGPGYAVFSPVSIDVSGAQMKDRIIPIDDHFKNAKIYAQELAAVEQSRNRLWNTIWRKLTF